MRKGSTYQPKSSSCAGGGAAGNTLVLGCNGTLTEMQETDFCKLQHTACNPSPLKRFLALSVVTKQFNVAAPSLTISSLWSLQVQLREQLNSILFTFKRSAVFKHLRTRIKNFAGKSILWKMWRLLLQPHAIMMASCEELLWNRQRQHDR